MHAICRVRRPLGTDSALVPLVSVQRGPPVDAATRLQPVVVRGALSQTGWPAPCGLTVGQFSAATDGVPRDERKTRVQMTRRAALIGSLVAAAALALGGAALAVALTRDDGGSFAATQSGYGRGAMMGYGDGMMTGYGPMQMAGAWRGGGTRESAGNLATAGQRVERWLADSGFDGFRVGEVMAFAWNDYALVRDAAGKPAFEVLAAPDGRWFMLEPTSMMWDTRYGMMRGWKSDPGWSDAMVPMMGGMMSRNWRDGCDWNGWWGGSGSAQGTSNPVTAAEAIGIAERYLAQAGSGEEAEREALAFPGYFTIDTTRSGEVVGMLSVNASTGAIWYHGWHGSFLGEQKF